MGTVTSDRVGIGWRPELAAGIFANLHRLDVVEVIADDYFAASRRKRDSLKILAAQSPVVLHGVAMGLASTVLVEQKRLAAMARLVELVRPEAWSEHLAFVRGGGLEIGHLAAPPRSAATIDGTAENVARAIRETGSTPHLENVATLIDPPGSTMGEAEWLARTAVAADCPLLLDLHNLHANATNHRYDPAEFLARMPIDRVSMIHMAGGKWIPAPDGRKRVLDDHLHDVPDEVYALLEDVAARATQPLTVILERDGSFPPMHALVAQLDAMRAALARGRQRGKPVAARRLEAERHAEPAA